MPKNPWSQRQKKGDGADKYDADDAGNVGVFLESYTVADPVTSERDLDEEFQNVCHSL